MELDFHLDPESGEPHIHDHGVTEEEVRQILANPGLVTKGRNNSRLALGQTADGRYLKVIYSESRDAPGIFVVTAFDLRGKDLKAYRRRRRKRNQ